MNEKKNKSKKIVRVWGSEGKREKESFNPSVGSISATFETWMGISLVMMVPGAFSFPLTCFLTYFLICVQLSLIQ